MQSREKIILHLELLYEIKEKKIEIRNTIVKETILFWQEKLNSSI
tara:strand:+ start:234 stop:368 length:135 start_codon:yes stop_codon:yes gene_type:complete